MNAVGFRMVTSLVLAISAGLLSGCVGWQLKLLEIEQKKAELQHVRDTSAFLEPRPVLARDFDAHVALGSDVFNRFLAGLDRYEIPIENSFGARLWFEQVRLSFRDGFPTANIEAKAVDGSGQVELKVRIRADILITAEPEKERLVFRFLLREVVPELRWGNLSWGRFWLAMSVLGVEGQKYIDALPATTVPLKADLKLNVDPKDRGRIDLSNGLGWIEVEQTLPHFKLGYVYRASRAVVLDDGVHVFFTLSRTE